MHKILIVDDEEGIVDIMERLLLYNGFGAIRAIGGKKAVEVLESGTEIDLMIVDMKMPKVDGLAVLTKARELGKTFPVIILTGSINMELSINSFIKLGFKRDDILYKPVDLSDVLDKVKKKLKIT